ncbi:MAG: hypothetical protein HQ498_09510 [Pseudohongiella sp.]|jgi:hypothetical protein|nr:hypothetical protein [Pseudohongiella sp.]
MHCRQRCLSTRVAGSIIVTAAASMSPAFADFDQWQISELFSNAEGSVQYIELKTAASNQLDLSGLTLVASDASGSQQNSLVFGANLAGETLNSKLLIATPSFVQSTGLSADFEIANGFLFTEGGSLNFANGTATLNYGAAQLAKNGVQSMDSNLAPQLPDPTNFAGLSATVSLSLSAVFDAANSILQLPVLDVPGIGLVNLSLDVNLDSLQFVLRDGYYVYASGITRGDTPAEFRPGNILYIPKLPVGNELYEFNLALVNDSPITFANPDVLSVSNVVPTPDPAAVALQQSIAFGEIEFAARCASCHGTSGGGGIGPNLRISSFNAFAGLRSKIDLTMPETSPSSCRDSSNSTCATDAANYILNVIQQ